MSAMKLWTPWTDGTFGARILPSGSSSIIGRKGLAFGSILAGGRGRRLSLSEIGCYLSHYNLWRRMADDNIPAAVILEDDARLRPGFAAAVAEAAACDWQWDLIYLYYGDSKKVCRELQPLGGGHSLVQLKGTLNKAAAYMLSLDGAKKLLPHCRLMHHGLDVVWKDYWNWGGRVYSIRPDPGVARKHSQHNDRRRFRPPRHCPPSADSFFGGARFSQVEILRA